MNYRQCRCTAQQESHVPRRASRTTGGTGRLWTGSESGRLAKSLRTARNSTTKIKIEQKTGRKANRNKKGATLSTSKWWYDNSSHVHPHTCWPFARLSKIVNLLFKMLFHFHSNFIIQNAVSLSF